MLPESISLKSTSGSPFRIEDKVASHLLLEMLLRQHPLSQELGHITRIEWQNKNWHPFDDVVIHLVDQNGKESCCGVSVKSDVQIGPSGAKRSLVDGMWEIFDSSQFSRERDQLLLYDTGRSLASHQTLHELLTTVRGRSPESFHQSRQTPKHAKLYKSFAKSAGSNDPLTAHLLSHFSHRHGDFESHVSSAENEARRLCGHALTLATSDLDGPKLWERLLAIARDFRCNGGECCIEKLISLLRADFHLLSYPGDSRVWDLLNYETSESINQESAVLQGNVSMPVVDRLEELKRRLEKGRLAVITGKSGIGKSATAKLYANKCRALGCTVLWIKADRILKIGTETTKIIKAALRVTKRDAILVIDALEGAKEQECALIGQIIASMLVSAESPWRVVLTCNDAKWEMHRPWLNKHCKDALDGGEEMPLKGLADADLNHAANEFPVLRHLLAMPRLRQILKTPKLLDIAINASSDASQWASELDLIEWWWQRVICGDEVVSDNEVLVRELAVRCGDDLVSEVPLREFQTHSQAANALIFKSILRRRGATLSFTHDLYADWSRLKYLQAQSTDIENAILRSSNPIWMNAIRLHGQMLLSQGGDRATWRFWLNRCGQRWGEGKTPTTWELQVIDTLLEAIIFCQDSDQVLESLKSDLIANQGRLLNRFLTRFMHAASRENPSMRGAAEALGAQFGVASQLQAEAAFRVPHTHLWRPILDFLIRNADTVTDLAPHAIAEVTKKWGGVHTQTSSVWSDVGSLALLNAEKTLRREIRFSGMSVYPGYSDWDRPEVRKMAYESALMAASTLPERALKLAQKAVGLADWEVGDLPDHYDCRWIGLSERDRLHERGILRHSIPAREPLQPTVAWDHGPQRIISKDFASACLDAFNLSHILRHNPDDAGNIVLACVIEWPKHRVNHHYSRYSFGRHGFRDLGYDFFPALYTKGPFWLSLLCDEDAGLRLIIKLINFATDRWLETHSEPSECHPVLSLELLSGTRHWRGGSDVYGWVHNQVRTEHIVGCALMALEKWLYDQVDAGKSVSHAISVILNEATSVAFAAILVNLGKYSPSLLGSDLVPVLRLWQVLRLDMTYSHTGTAFVGSFSVGRSGETKLLQEWGAMPHRRKQVIHLCQHRMISHPEETPIFEELGRHLANSGLSPDIDERSLRLIRKWASGLERHRWVHRILEDGSEIWEHQLPPELDETEARVMSQRRLALEWYRHKSQEELYNRTPLSDAEANSVWSKIREIKQWLSEPLGEGCSRLDDSGHALSGLLALLFCRGGHWLEKHPDAQVFCLIISRKMFAKPETRWVFSESDGWGNWDRDPMPIMDMESFLARIAVRLWANAPENEEYRRTVLHFVTVKRYAVIWAMFDEAAICAAQLGESLNHLLAVASIFARFRHKVSGQYDPDGRAARRWRRMMGIRFVRGDRVDAHTLWSFLLAHQRKTHERTTRKTKREWRTREFAEREDFSVDMTVLEAIWRPVTAARTPECSNAADVGLARLLLSSLGALKSNAVVSLNDRIYCYDSDRFILGRILRRIIRDKGDTSVRFVWEQLFDLGLAGKNHIQAFLDSMMVEVRTQNAVAAPWFLDLWESFIVYGWNSPTWTLPMHGKARRMIMEMRGRLLVFGMGFVQAAEDLSELIARLDPYLKEHITHFGGDPHELQSILGFHLALASEERLIDLLCWLHPHFLRGDRYFWGEAATLHSFRDLLVKTFRLGIEALQREPAALSAFKMLLLEYATVGDPVAQSIQAQFGYTHEGSPGG